ncbi:MAG: hypothetical protein Q7R66_06765 [Undibacterium sp.]|uniref:hypothetical protein n=1 Tax=Undibacterium sp. TaxID=1914977 RepID=UPI0027166191|nr:hypothetical protein [Undibacterium sp.]MDO8651871.1 hypothetical protein [Undibacterium sp.]
MNKLLRLAVYLFSFIFARGTLFFAPIALANLLPTRSYGAMEWAHAAASFAASLATLGTAAALPLIQLNRSAKGTVSGILIHHLILVGICLLAMCASFFWNAVPAFQLSLVLTSAVTLQALWSIQLKTAGKGEASLLLDAGLFALLAIVALIAKYFEVIDALQWLMIAASLYVLGLFGMTAKSLTEQLRIDKTILYRATLELSLPLMLGALVTIAATTSGRLVIGYLGGALLTADYAILARAAALPIVAHQIILVAKFRHLYKLPDREMERVMLVIIGCVSCSVIGLWIVSPMMGWMLGPAFFKAFHSYTLPAILILSQSILWSAISLNDTVNTRKQTMGKILPWSILFLLASMPLAMYLIRNIGVSLAHFVYVHSVVMLLFYLVQACGMYVAGIRLWRSWLCASGSFVLLSAIATLIYS